MGRIPLWPGCRDETLPGASGWESIEHYGPLARTVADAALFLAAVAGPDPRDRLLASRRGRRLACGGGGGCCRRRCAIAWVPALGRPADRAGSAGADDVRRRALRQRDLALRVEETASPFGDLIEADRAIVALETDISGLRKLAAGREHLLSPPLRALLAPRVDRRPPSPTRSPRGRPRSTPWRGSWTGST